MPKNEEPTPTGQSAPDTSDTWRGLRFLLGNWTGEGGEVGAEGEQATAGSGRFTFALDLQDNIVVRKNHAHYPATSEKPAYDHYDLMIIYHDQIPGQLRAIYFDNEGHVIEYAVARSETAMSTPVVEFTRPPSDLRPGFRLTYVGTDDSHLAFTFEFAAPGAAQDFSPYMEAQCRRSEEDTSPDWS
jgi:hypothetical protein